MNLSLGERLILQTLYTILIKISDGDETNAFRKARRAVAEGYPTHYVPELALGTGTSRDPLTEEACTEILNILRMYEYLQGSADELGRPAAIDDEDLRFPGFEERRRRSFVRYVFNTHDDFSWLEKQDSGLRSGKPMLGKYRRMLQEFEARQDELMAEDPLGREDIIAILNA